MGGGIWGHSGVASDGTNMFAIIGNTFNTGGKLDGAAKPLFGCKPGQSFEWSALHRELLGADKLVLA